MSSKRDIANYNISFSYAAPYTVFLSPTVMNQSALKDGDPVQFTLQEGQKQKTLIGKASLRKHLRLEKEAHALFYGISQSLNHLSEQFPDRFDRFQQESFEENAQWSFSRVKKYVETINQWNAERLKNKEVIIGCGFLTFLQGEPVREGDSIFTPFSLLDRETFVQSLTADSVSVSSFKRYEDAISSPKQIYLCSKEYVPLDLQIKQLKATLQSVKYLMPDKNYLFTNQGIAFHGPVKMAQAQVDPIYVSDSCCINTIPMYFGQISSQTADFQFEFNKVKEIVEVEEQGELSTDFKDETVAINVAKTPVTLSVHSHVINYKYSHVGNSRQRKKIESLLDRLVAHRFPEAFKTDFHKTQLYPKQFSKNYMHHVWVWDTNALYYQISQNQPVNLTHFLLPRPYLYGKTFKIPWQVICEINKHKDAAPQTREASIQGMKNLKILRFLANQGFFTLDVEQIPKQIDVSILPGSGATDLGILSVVEQHPESLLLTRDQRLIDLCKIKQIPVQDMGLLPRLGIDHEDWLWQRVKEKLGKGVTPYQQIVEILVNALQTIDDVKGREKKRKIVYKAHAGKWLNNWKKRLIRYPKQERIMIALSESVKLIPTYSLLADLSSYIIQDLGKNYLDHNFLEMVHNYTALPSHIRPFVLFHIPEPYIFKAVKEKTSTTTPLNVLTKLNELENALTVPFTIQENCYNDDLDKIALQAAKQIGGILLCREQNRELKKLGNLLRIRVEQIDGTSKTR